MFSIMAVSPGSYSPDNWSSGYRVYTSDSVDKRAELYNDFSYWMVRKFEIEVSARENYDSQLLSLINDNVNYSVVNRSRISSLDNQLQPLKTTVTSNESLSAANSSRISNVDVRLTSNESLSAANSSRISNVDSRLTSNETLSAANSSRISNVDFRLTSTESEMSTLSAMVANPDLSLISNLFGVNTIASTASAADGVYTKLQKFLNNELKTQLVELRTLTSQTNTKLDTLNTTLTDEIKAQLVMIRNNITALNATQLLTTAAIKDSSDKNAENLTYILSSLKGLKNYDDASFKKYVYDMFFNYFTAGDYSGGIVSGDGVITRVIKGQTGRTIDQFTSLFTTQNNKLDSVKNEIVLVGNKIKDYTILLTSMNATQLLTNAAIKDSSDDNAENLTFLNGTLKGLKNYDDSSFKTFISDRFNQYFVVSASYESGGDSGDGIFTRLVKGQFTRLIAELNRQLTLSFTATTNNIESFKTFLREEFGLLNDWASLQVDWSTMINDNILVAIAALDKILAKPVANVNVEVPPSIFDFDRLQEMLDGISFGNVVNEAGTNVWDVLKELIEAMGKVAESIVGIVPDLIEELVALIIPENKNFFSEGIDGLISSFDSKFEWTATLSNSFKNVYSEPKSIKSLTIPIGGKSYNVVPEFVDLGMIKVIMTGYFSFLTLFTSYKRIVGGGDVIQ